jgi:hypothetical protein
MAVDHKAVMPVTNINRGWQSGWLCSCGRTILGKYRVDEHFVGVPMHPGQLRMRRLEALGMHIDMVEGGEHG